jgi:DNA-binding XRE family transcriptional regulator
MGVPARRVTDAEMAAKTDVVLKKLMKDRGLTPEEFARRVAEYRLPSNPMRPLGLAIQAQRKEKGMTRKQLATRAGLSPRLVTALERGFLKDLSLAAFFNLAFALGVSVEQIVEKSGWSE